MKPTNFLLSLCILLSIHSISSAQQPAFNQNSSRSNNFRSSGSNSDAWNFGINTSASFGVSSNENTLFRGNSISSKLFGRYYFGNVGLGLSSGFIPGAISDNSLNNFLTDRKLQRDQVQILSGKPFNGYLAFGPTVRFGNRVQFSADLQGGMFLNDPGSVSITQLGAQRALYRFDAGSKNFYPGFSGNINIVYPISNSTHFFIATEYLQSKSSIRLLDLNRGIDIPAEQTRDVKLFTIGAGITKSFGNKRETGSGMATGRKHIAGVKYEDIVISRDEATGQASGKRLLPTVNKKEIAIDEPGVQRILTHRDIATGQASGKRLLPTVNKKEIAIDEPGVERILAPIDIATGQASGKIMNESCGPVTLKKTFPDGTTEEKTFACKDDAMDYERQTQQTSFGEKVQSGLSQTGREVVIHRDLAARNILLGRITWSGNNSSGIVTNKNAAVSSVSNLGGGASTAAYARNGFPSDTGAASFTKGIVTNIYAREAGSGMATGKRQYEPLFSEGNENNRSSKLGMVKSNPLYKENGNSGSNPLYEPKDKLSGGADNDCNGIAGLTVYLIDANTNTKVATSQTGACGEFWFANVPSGNYVVKVSGAFLSKKGYDMYAKSKMDVAGEILAADDYWSIDITTDTGSVEHAQALIKTKTKSNQSNDRIINTSRSNIKNISSGVGDIDGDGATDMIVGSTVTGFGEKVNAGLHAAGGALSQGASLLGGALPGGAVISAAMLPGDPIPGIDVHLKQSSVGTADQIFQTNEYGEFEFPNLKEGNYTISFEMNYYIDDETLVKIGNDN